MLTLSKQRRIKSSNQITEFFSCAKKKHSRSFFILLNIKNKEEPQYAFIAGKKIGNAVKRNLFKRKLREVTRVNQHCINKRYDIVFCAKKNIELVSVKQLNVELNSFLKNEDLFLD